VKPIMRGVMIVAVLAGAATRAAAQSGAVQVAATAGIATDERGVRASVVTLAPSLLLNEGAHLSVTLGANATRFSTAASQIGGSAGLTASTPASSAGFALSLNTSASAAHASFDATFAQIDATPALNWTAGVLTLVGGVHVASGYTGVSETTTTTAPTPAGPFGPSQPAQPLTTTQLVSESRSASGASFGGDLRFGAGTPTATLLSFREEPMSVGGMLVTDRLAGATVNFSGATLSALIGHRDAPDEHADFASGSAVIPLAGDVALTMAGGKYPSNRLTGAAGGQFFSAGLSIRIGGARLVSLPSPDGVRAPAPELTRLAIRATDADSVSVAGDWDAWKPAATRRAPNGVWYVDLPLKAGEYRYAFLVDGREWRVPEGAVAVDDGFGGKAAYVTVRTADSVLAKHNQEEK
jgi:hypothetical protein